MSEQQLHDLVERAASRARMPAGVPADDVRRGEAALIRRRRGAAVLAAAASVAAVVGVLAVTGPGEPRRAEAPPATSTSSAPTAEPPAPGTPEALEAAVVDALATDGDQLFPLDGYLLPEGDARPPSAVDAQLTWGEADGPLVVRARVAASAADAAWGCEDRCELTTYEVGGLTAWTTPRDDLGQTATLLVRADGSAAAISVPPSLLSSGALTRADIDRFLTSPDVAPPPGVPTGPAPVRGTLVDAIARDALPGLEVTSPSSDVRAAGSGTLDGQEVDWQADPAWWSTGSCFWQRRCEVAQVDGVRLELSRPPGDGGPYAGYVAVEHQGPVWRTRVLLPEDAADLGDVAALLTDPRWSR